MHLSLVDIARQFYLDEINDHRLYQALAQHERDPELRKLLHRIAAVEQRHAEFWWGLIETRGGSVPRARARRWQRWLLSGLQKLVNPMFLVGALELGEAGAVKRYYDTLKTAELDSQERQRLRGIIVDELEHEVRFRSESQKRGAAHTRDFVLGMNDGLVELLGAVTGLSAVYAHNPLIVGVSGLVVGIAGALSMGIGAFISVRSQRQVKESQSERMEVLFEVAPQRAVNEYRERLTESGVPGDTAREIAERIGTSHDAVRQLLLPEAEEHELRSGLFTGSAYVLGVVFPVAPYFLFDNALVALAGSVLLAGMALAVTAAVISVLSGISLRRKILEMVAAGFGAAIIAYAFGAFVQQFMGVVL